jgi:hypothetical protein
MHHIRMNKTVSDETIELSSPDGRRIKDQVIDHFLLAESRDGNKAGNNNQYERNS